MERWQEAYLFERGATPLVVAILFTDSDLIAHAIYTFGEPTPLEFMNTFVNALLQHLSTQTFLFHEVVDVKILFGCERSAANASFPCSDFTRNLIFEASVHKLCPHLGGEHSATAQRATAPPATTPHLLQPAATENKELHGKEITRKYTYIYLTFGGFL